MSMPVLTMEGSIRFARILHGVMLFSMCLYIIAAEMFGDRMPRDIHVFQWGFMTVSFLLVVVAVLVRVKLVQPTAQILQTQPNDSATMGRWRSGILTSFVLAEAVMLFGFALRFLGGTLLQATPFYAVAIALMLLWWPRRP